MSNHVFKWFGITGYYLQSISLNHLKTCVCDAGYTSELRSIQ